MNPTRDYIEKQKAICRDEWFKSHRAAILGDASLPPVMTVINWQNPDSWNYGCRFIIHRRWLCVVGDIGEAVYEWGQDVTLPFLAGLDFHYFHGKCQASPSGRKFEQWDTDVLELNRTARLKELKGRVGTDDESKENAEELEVLENNSKCSKDEWDSDVRHYYDATGDAEGASSLAEFGIVPSVHAIGMFVGLQMAIAQLTEEKQ